MAKRSTRRRNPSTKPRSLVEMARRFEALSKAVRAAQVVLAAKEQELSVVRDDLAAATGSVVRPSVAVSRGQGRRMRSVSPPAGGGEARKGSLDDLICRAMADGRERGPTEVFAAVRGLGYKSKSNPKIQQVMVNQSLSRLTKAGKLRKPGRGKYVKS